MNWTWISFMFASPVWVETTDKAYSNDTPIEQAPMGYALTVHALRRPDGFLDQVVLTTEAKGQVTVGVRNVELRVGDWTATPEPMNAYFHGRVVPRWSTPADRELPVVEHVYCEVVPTAEIHTMTYGYGRTLNGWNTNLFLRPVSRRAIPPEREVFVSGEVWTSRGWQWFGLVTQAQTEADPPIYIIYGLDNADLCPLLSRSFNELPRFEQRQSNRRDLLYEATLEQARKLDPLSEGTLEHGTCVDPGEAP